MGDTSPWANYGLDKWLEIPVGLEQRFEFEFTGNAYDSFARLTFQVGTGTANLTFDHVWLEIL